MGDDIIMKTLILNGSPRINGDTSSLINKITEKITGEYRIVDAYRCNISPCPDCRYCWKNQSGNHQAQHDVGTGRKDNTETVESRNTILAK